MTPKPTLKLDWCSHEAAKYACEKWHYSGRMYVNKTVKIGVWEGAEFVGVVVYGTGCQHLGNPYGLTTFETCELVRVALRSHAHPVSRMLAVSFSMLRKANPKLRLIVSFSDTAQGHHGGIYQATNWLYAGSMSYHEYEVKGERVPPRTMYNRHGKGGQSVAWLRANVDPNARRVETPPKHKYLMPLDAAMRAKVLPLSKPYPKKTRAGSDTGDTPADQAGEGSAILTPALHTPPTPPEAD